VVACLLIIARTNLMLEAPPRPGLRLRVILREGSAHPRLCMGPKTAEPAARQM